MTREKNLKPLITGSLGYVLQKTETIYISVYAILYSYEDAIIVPNMYILRLFLIVLEKRNQVTPL